MLKLHTGWLESGVVIDELSEVIAVTHLLQRCARLLYTRVWCQYTFHPIAAEHVVTVNRLIDIRDLEKLVGPCISPRLKELRHLIDWESIDKTYRGEFWDESELN